MRRILLLLLFALLSTFIGCSCDDPADPEPGKGAVRVQTLPEGLDASWVLTGPGNYVLQGFSDTLLTSRTVGNYAISWEDLAYQFDPDNQILELSLDDTISFIGVYEPDPSAAGIIIVDVEPDYIQPEWVLTGPGDFEQAGQGDAEIKDALPGDYRIEWLDQDRWLTPSLEIKRLPGVGIIAFKAGYILQPAYSYTLQIETEPDVLGIPWVLKVADGNGYFDHKGVGDHTISNLPLSAQTLEWKSVPDWIAPDPDVLDIDPLADQTVVVSANYTQRPPLPLNMVPVSAGSFMMGSTSAELGHQPNEEPQHMITLTRSLLVSDTEITQRQWHDVMNTSPSWNLAGANHPVENVSWEMTLEFCNALSLEEGLTPVYTIDGDNTVWDREADGFRLPTEAEWEYLCRAGTSTALFIGDLEVDDCNYDSKLAAVGWYCYNGGLTQPVASRLANDWGLYDMHGNVMEWCWDAYGDAWYDVSPDTDPAGPAADGTHVVRGGYYNNSAALCRSAARAGLDLGSSGIYYVGFRVVRNN
jgi:formylglycine-generating enzyme required for sulfatase activity